MLIGTQPKHRGERATWSCLARINNHFGFERTLDDCYKSLAREKAHGKDHIGPHVPDRTPRTQLHSSDNIATRQSPPSFVSITPAPGTLPDPTCRAEGEGHVARLLEFPPMLETDHVEVGSFPCGDEPGEATGDSNMHLPLDEDLDELRMQWQERLCSSDAASGSGER